jgi:hypothetical protein
MTMRTIFTFLVLTIAGFQLSAQNLICVQSGNNASFYTSLDSAVTYAQPNDYIHVPSGSFPLTTPIDKPVHIIGRGVRPDSLDASGGVSRIVGSIGIYSSFNGGSIEGCILTGNIFIDANAVVSNYVIRRNHLRFIRIESQMVTNLLIAENVVYDSYSTCSGCSCNMYPSLGSSSSYLTVTGNVFYRNISVGNYSTFSNNVFMSGSHVYGPHSTFKNNIFLSAGSALCLGNPNASYCTFHHNIFMPEEVDVNFHSTAIRYANSFGQTLSGIFLNLSSGSAYDIMHDYRVNPSGPAIGFGVNGEDCGIYGGNYPAKEGWIPFNPYISVFQVPNSTNPDGTLPINIKVTAQDR